MIKGKTEVREPLHLVHHKSHMDWPRRLKTGAMVRLRSLRITFKDFTDWLMLYREIIALYSYNNTEHMNRPKIRGQTAENLRHKPDVAYSNHWT
jgi:hypothetical protein